MERFDLVCSRSHLPRLAQSLFFAGALIGSLACGPLSDAAGRRAVYLVSLGGSGTASAVALLAPTFGVWVAARVVAGACIMAVNLVSNVYRTEAELYFSFGQEVFYFIKLKGLNLKKSCNLLLSCH